MKVDVIILAGGMGTRLKSVVSEVPKPMAPINSKPFLAVLLDLLPLENIGSIILSVGYKHEVIKDYFGDSFKNVAIKYAVENEPLGTGGAIKLAWQLVENEDVLVLNGDTYFNLDLEQLKQTHKEADAEITLGLKTMESPDRYGTVILENQRVIKFQEKQQGIKQGLINGGVYWANKSLINHFPSQKKFSFESEFLEKQISQIKIGGYIDHSMFIDIGIPEDYAKAQQILTK